MGEQEEEKDERMKEKERTHTGPETKSCLPVRRWKKQGSKTYGKKRQKSPRQKVDKEKKEKLKRATRFDIR